MLFCIENTVKRQMMMLKIAAQLSVNVRHTPVNTVKCANVAWNSLSERSANANVVRSFSPAFRLIFRGLVSGTSLTVLFCNVPLR